MFFKGVIIVAGITLVAISATVLLYDFESPQIPLNNISEENSQKIMDIGKQFIISSPTYSFDGISDSLEIKIISEDPLSSKFILEGKFKTLHAGYGNREKLDLSEDVTLHTIMVSIVDEKIISAMIDNQWDELNQISCNTAQC